MQVPNPKKVASSEFQIDFSSRFSNRFPKKVIQITQIQIRLKFKKYQFKRVKRTGNQNVAYVDKEWIGKQVVVIPVNLHITDRYIESNYDEEKQEYNLTLDSPAILPKNVNKGKNIGRVNLQSRWAGYDVLIIEEPNLDNF